MNDANFNNHLHQLIPHTLNALDECDMAQLTFAQQQIEAAIKRKFSGGEALWIPSTVVHLPGTQ